jgi:hypothetical protein
MSQLIYRVFNIIIVMVVFICHNHSYAQKSHEIGMLWETMMATGSLPEYAPLQHQMTYPGGDFRTASMKNLAGLGLWIGVTNWTGRAHAEAEIRPHSFYVSEGGLKNNEAALFTFPISMKKHVRNLLPTVIVNGEEELRYADSRTGSLPEVPLLPENERIADERIETIWATNVGVRVRMRSYALANKNHNSYIIREYTFTNDGNADRTKSTIEYDGQNLTGVYFGFQFYLIPGGDRGHPIVDQHDDWAVYYGNQPGDTLRGIFYKFDGNADENHYAGDDTGDPDRTTGEFKSPQYPAFGVLHADMDWNDETDNRSQPSAVNIQPLQLMRSYLDGFSPDQLYSELSSVTHPQGTVGQSTNPYDPTISEPVILMSFGPYDIPFDQDIQIVLYEAVGSISQKLAISAGNEWRQGTLEFNGLTDVDAAKNALLATGKDSLLMHASHAEYAWQLGLENLPTPPPAPDKFIIVSGPGRIDLEWDSVADIEDWQTGELDFAGYRIYRTEGNYTNVYSLLAEINDDISSYTDWDVERGKRYYYTVTAFDDGTQNTTGIHPGQALESSPFSTRNFREAAVPFLGASKNLDSVYVVPNPFHIQGLAYGGFVEYTYTKVPRIEEKISFVGLPAKATIRIFTMHGDLIATIPHPNPHSPGSVLGSADEAWFQITDQWQNIKSGVYIYHVEGWDLDGTPLGSTTGKFVIIR